MKNIFQSCFTWFFACCIFCFCRSAQAEDYKIGAIFGFTGPAQVWASSAREGVELAVEEINAKGGVAGKKFSVIYEDSRSEPKTAVTAYRKLIDQEKVKVVIGELWTFLTVPLVSLSARDKVVLLSPTVMDESIKETSEYFFTFGHRFRGLEKGMQKFFELHPAIKRPALISFEDYWNNAFIGLTKSVMQKRGLAVSEEIRVNEFFPDLRTEFTRVKGAKADGVIVTWRPEIALQRMNEQKLDVPLLCSSDTVEAVLYRSGNKALLEGSYFLDWRPNEEFSKKYTAKFGRQPLYEAHNSYEIIRSLAKALGKPGTDLRANLRDISYDGVGGRIDFSHAPFVNQAEGKLFRVEKGGFQVVN